MGRNSLTSGDRTSLVERHLITTLKKPQRAYQNPSKEASASFGGVLPENSASFPNVLTGLYMITKMCKHCKEHKPLKEFFSSPYEDRAAAHGTSMYYKRCHGEGKIKYGYGWYGDKHKSPEDTINNT